MGGFALLAMQGVGCQAHNIYLRSGQSFCFQITGPDISFMGLQRGEDLEGTVHVCADVEFGNKTDR